ncbi:unnamed protein product [Pieris macdunnoughi]|uniref:Uncharacterized protein n=1 Tax=Pieris macdunnoughi TaxID=345717 RepID=A0A821Y3C0_9NEOP|nr:unnamed protein product [Pieris macdunnoughi]
MPRDRERSSSRDRRSSSYSSESSYERKKSKYKHKRRSRSKDHLQTKSYKRRLSNSRSKHRRRSYSRSASIERYDSRSKLRSSSHSRSKRSKYSRDRSRSRLSSRDRKYNKKSHKCSRSKSRSNSFDIEPPLQLDNTDTIVEKAIKAAEAAGLTMTKIPTYEYKDVAVKEDMPTIHDRNLLDELNNDAFVQKSFSSTKRKRQNIVIDLNAETVKVPEADVKARKDDSIINFSEILCQEDLKEMWITKLYQYRKKMLREEL